MLFDKINTILGMIKIKLLSIFCGKKIKIGKNCRIKKDFCIVIDKNSKFIIGDNFRAKYNFKINCLNGGILKIGNNVFINNNCDITAMKKIEIGNNVLIGHNLLVIDHDHNYKKNIKNYVSNEIKIGNNVWIGANVTILKGVKIGNNVVVGANSLICKDVEDNCIITEEKDYNIRRIGEK